MADRSIIRSIKIPERWLVNDTGINVRAIWGVDKRWLFYRLWIFRLGHRTSCLARGATLRKARFNSVGTIKLMVDYGIILLVTAFSTTNRNLLSMFHAPHPSELAYVPFVSVKNMMALFNTTGVETVLRELADYIEADFMRWSEFDKIPRIRSHSVDGVIELMPTADATNYAFKYVNGHPKNTRDGYQTVSAFGVLSSVANGYPILLTEMTMLTALRTAAVSALAAKYLARPDARTMAIIGNGAQCEFQAMAFRAICGINTVRLYDIDPAATEKVSRNLSGRGIWTASCRSSQEAVAGADIITTCTADKRKATILSDNMVGAGIHINAIGGDCPGKTELQRNILIRSGIFVEFAPQTRIEGEIQQLDDDHPVTELWQVMRREAEGRRDSEQITVFDSVGFAIEDFSALRYVHDKIADTPFFEKLDMLADPDDPRDLFGMLQRANV